MRRSPAGLGRADVREFGEVVGAEHGEVERELAGVLGAVAQKVRLRAMSWAREVTISSLIASRGGFVTWAKSSLK